MSSNHTTNYNLNQWVKPDRVLMSEFNADNAKIDAAIKAVNDRVDGLSSTVNTKASQSALNSLSAQVAQRGNCQIDFFTYTGTGTTGESGPTKVDFPRKPLFFIIFDAEYSATGTYGMTRIQLDLSQNNATGVATWSGNELSFYAGSAKYQLNTQGTTYYVVALSAMD